MKTLALLATLAGLAGLVGLAACSDSAFLAVPKGPVFPLNAGHWQPTATDLQVPRTGGPG